MNLAPIISRLQAQLAWASEIRGAADFSAAAARMQFAADLYVIDFGERAQRNARINGHRQKVDVTFAIVHQSRNVNDPAGGDAVADLDSRRTDVIRALAGWAPSLDDDPIDFLGGELVRFVPPAVLWADRFTTSYQLVI